MSLWDRQRDETHPAYVAFCVYRDLGDARSLDRAWQKQSQRPGEAPGRWSLWSRTFRWVERAHAYDEHLEAQERLAFERELAKLGVRRARFELKAQDLFERQVERIDTVLAKADAAPITDVTQETVQSSKDPGSKKIVVEHKKTKVKGINFSGYARLWKEYRDAARSAIVGVRPVVDDDGGNQRSIEPLPDFMIDALLAKKAETAELIADSNAATQVEVQTSSES